MLIHHLKVALRNIRKHRLFSSINIAGLSLGLTGFLLIAGFVRHERGVDAFHANARDIHLVVRDNTSANGREQKSITGAPLAPLLLQNIPQVREAVRITLFGDQMVRANDKQFVEPGFAFADESVFRVFTFPLERGDAAAALRDPFTVVLTPRTAERYFGGEDPVGRTVEYLFGGRVHPFTVTGILRGIPEQSHLQFDFLASYASMPALTGEWFMTAHWDSPTWTYVQLAPGSQPDDVQPLLTAVTQRHVDKRSFTAIDHHLLPLREIYFRSPGYLPGRAGNAELLVILSAVSVFVLLIACLNFMNLSTSRAGARSREIGLRKVAGARKGQLVGQFLGESLVLSLLALGLAMGLAQIFLPSFRAFVGRNLSLDYAADPLFLGFMVLIAAAVGLLAGIYPAFVLSSFKPVQVVRGRLDRGRAAGAVVRRILVVAQFAISIALIITVLLAARQSHFIRSADVGFDREKLLTVPIRDRAVSGRFDALKARWLQDPGVAAVTATSMKPGVDSPNGISLKALRVDDYDAAIVYVEADYARTLGLKITAGRDFQSGSPADAAGGLLVNRSFLTRVGWGLDEAVGQPADLFFKEAGGRTPVASVTVIGVLEDFHARDLTSPMQPLIFRIDERRHDHILVRLAGSDPAATLGRLRAAWEEFRFAQPFEATFLADDMDAVYRPFRTFGAVTRDAAVLAVLIACLGLFGLASYTIEKRTREIGIRKVLGATVPGLVGLISRDFLILVAAANVLAWPAAYALTNVWLRNFAFRTSVSPWVFVSAGAIALLVAFLTVAGQSVRAALADPAESLRVE